MRSNGEDFRAAGYGRAYEILSRCFNAPPSFEVFMHDWMRRRSVERIMSADTMAERLCRELQGGGDARL